MGTYWVNRSIGTGGGDGSAELPWDSLATANTARTFVTGDIINCINGTPAGGGVSRSGVTWTGNLTGVTIQVPPGYTGYEERKSVVMNTGDIVNVSGNKYEYPAGAGLNIRGVSWDYGNNTTTNGSRYGFLTLVASAAAVTSVGKWFYDSGTGLITFDVGGDPLARTVEYAIRTADNVAVVQFNNMTDCVVSGLTISYGLMNNGEGQYGNLISATTCTRTTWRGLDLYDGGNHMTLMSGGNLVGNLITGCTYHGCASSGAMHTFFAASTSTGANEANNNTMVIHGYLNIDGTASAITVTGINGYYSHVGGGGTVIDNLTYRNNTVTYILNTLGAPFTSGNATAPSDPENWTTYSVKFIDCTLRGGRQSAMSSPESGNCCYVNCDLDYANTFNVALDYSVLLAAGNTFGHFGCLITSTSDYIIFNIQGTCTAIFDACTFINRDTTHITTRSIISSPSGTPTISVKRSLYAYSLSTSTNLIDAGGSSLTVANNAYYNASATTGDAGAIQFSTNPFTAIATSGALTNVARKIKHTGASPLGNLQGVNHKRYVKNYGAYQYPPTGGRSRLNRSRLMGGCR